MLFHPSIQQQGGVEVPGILIMVGSVQERINGVTDPPMDLITGGTPERSPIGAFAGDLQMQEALAPFLQ
jgi:hypothetical protein